MAGLADRRARSSYLPGDGLGFALSHRMDSEGWILAQASDAPTRLGVARLVGSDCLTTESTSAASTAAKHRCKPGVAVVFRRRRAVVLGLSAMEISRQRCPPPNDSFGWLRLRAVTEDGSRALRSEGRRAGAERRNGAQRIAERRPECSGAQPNLRRKRSASGVPKLPSVTSASAMQRIDHRREGMGPARGRDAE